VRRWLRWIGYGLAGLIGLVVVVLLGVYFASSRHLGRTYRFPDMAVQAGGDSASLERGRHLVEVVGKCQECHGDDYGGKMLADSWAFGRLAATNITAGRGGVKKFTDADWDRALRHGVDPDGRPLVFMPAEAFTVLSDGDLGAIVGYMRTVAPVDREWPAPRVGPIARALYLKGDFPLLPVTLIDHNAARRPPTPGVTVEYGVYLATIGGCRNCHGADLAGTGAPDVPDITRSRLGTWTETDFFRALRQGQRPDGGAIDPVRMPWIRSGKMTDEEMRALWLYIRSLPGKPTT
jgi:cytochrome c553